MQSLSDEIVDFFTRQGFVIISTLDKNGGVHNACKGIVKISPSGSVYLLDLYKSDTYSNIKRNPNMSITAVDEHKFKGYSLKGKGKVISWTKMQPEIVKAWEDKITQRITQRLIRNIRGEQGHHSHPEASFPSPAYLVVMQVKEVVDLTPHHLK